MRIQTTISVGFLMASLVGCSSGSSQPVSPDEQPGNPGTEEPATAGSEEPVASPPASGDEPVASSAPEGETPAASPDCSQEIALACGAGLKDGCLLPHPKDKTKKLTHHHVCVPEKEKGGVPCEQEIARQCGKGQIDGCLTKPVASDTHVCVQEKP